MTKTEAIKIIKPEGDSIEDIKRAYRMCALEFHPDRNPNGLHMMQLVNAAYEILKNTIGTWSANTFKRQSSSMSGEKSQHYDFGTSMTDELQKIFDKIKHWPQITVELIGDWMWLFNAPAEVAIKLSAWGFNFSPARNGYYYIPQSMRNQPWMGKKSKEDYIPFDEIRNIFGSKRLKQEPYKTI